MYRYVSRTFIAVISYSYISKASGFSNYRLILNVPYLVLEETADVWSQPVSPLEHQTRVLWEDLSYLTLESSTGQQSHHHAIYESQTTVVISGCDHSKWYGYAFGKIGPDDPCPDDVEDSEADAEEEYGWEEDFFATGGCAPTLNPGDLIWDPRTYFLRAAQIRLDIVTKASEYLVRKIEAGAKDWASNLLCLQIAAIITDSTYRFH
jgi:hypothetical protein